MAMGTPFPGRMDRLQEAMATSGVDAVLLSVGPELPWLTGYEAMPLERLTMLVVSIDGSATLVVPELEAPRVAERPAVFDLRPFPETEDPLVMVAELLAGARRVAVGDHTWARFVVDLQQVTRQMFERAGPLVGPLRRRKDDLELETLQRAAAAADRVACQLQAGDIDLVGRSEADVSAEIGRRLIAEGHARVNFAIVASGPNSASPHHEPGDRRIERGEVVLCDFGGTMRDRFGVGYCSDITRCVTVGSVPDEVSVAYGVLRRAHEAATNAATVGTAAATVDAVARHELADGGFEGRCIHRVGHGIGVEAHEDPYLVEGNDEPLAAGNVFSIEPGIYLPGRWGLRLEDIVVASHDGAVSLNQADRSLVVLDPAT